MVEILSVIKPADGGLIYAETNLRHFFPEPLNTLTSCFFIFLAIYWIATLKIYSRKHAFLSLCSWMLLIGSIGGTAYHGLRRYAFFIVMDWGPILLLCVMAGAWFWKKVLANSFYAILVLVLFMLLQYPVSILKEGRYSHYIMNINYALMALMVLVPLVLYLAKNNFRHYQWVLAAFVSFTLALFFRIADGWNLLPVGTHFLWHLFGAASTYSMFLFIYKINEGLRVVYSRPAKVNFESSYHKRSN